MRIPPEEFEALVEQALDGLPEEFAELLENVAVMVQDEPDPEDLEAMGIDPDEDLFGLYQGVPLADLPEHQPLRALLGEAAAQEIVAVPLRMRDRLVGVFAATPRAVGEGGAELADLERLAALASHALELCILRRKLRKS